MTATAAREAGARVFPIPPPVYYIAAFAMGYVLNRVLPWEIDGRPVTTVVGALVVIAGLGLAWSAIFGVIRHRTTIVPHHPVSALVTTGMYRISRNPMYTGLAIAYLGGTLLLDSWWPLIPLPLALVAVRLVVIRPEERYLAQRFGAEYTEYRARVRRWL